MSHQRPKLAAVAAAAVLAAGAATAPAQTRFGVAAAMSGDRLVVGAPVAARYQLGDGAATEWGGAVFYERQGTQWVYSGVWLALDEDPGEIEMWAAVVAIDGELAVVGTVRDAAGGPQAGAAYIIEEDAGTWQQVHKLTAPTPKGYDRFGISAAVSGTTIFIGADGADTACGDVPDGTTCNNGVVYVFTPSGSAWVHSATLQASDASYGQRFGRSLAVSGDVLVVGAPTDNDSGRAAGAVYIFEKDSSGNWVEEAVWRPSDAAEMDQAGYRVACFTGTSGTQVAVSAVGSGSVDTGAVYVMDYAAGAVSNVTKLTLSGASGADAVGLSLALGEDVVVAGRRATGTVGPEFPGGIMASFRSGGVWSAPADVPLGSYLQTPTTARLGTAVAISGGWLAVGAPPDGTGVRSGSVQMLELDSTPAFVHEQVISGGDAFRCDIAHSADFNGDGLYNLADWTVFDAEHAAQTPRSDFDGDGQWGPYGSEEYYEDFFLFYLALQSQC